MVRRAPRLVPAAILLTQFTAASWAGVDLWTPVGPPGAAQVQALALDPAAPAVLYAGFASERRVWKSSDGGDHWLQASAGIPVEAGSIFALAVSPADSDIVLAATSNRQIYRSADGGGSWTLSSDGLPSGSVGGRVFFVFEPGSPSTVYVSWNAAGGSLFRSEDSGLTWERRDPVLDVGVRSLTIAASTPPALYAALGGRGIYKSIDGAQTWTPAGNGLPFAPGPPYDSYNVLWVVADPGDPNLLYTISNRDLELYRTEDGAGLWSPVSTEAYGFNALWVQAGTGHLFATGNDYLGAAPTLRDCLFRSEDGGETFTNLTPAHRNARMVNLHPTVPTTLYAYLDEGIYKTADGGATWSPAFGAMRNYDANAAFLAALPGTYWAGFWASMGRTENGGASFSIMTPSASLPFGETFAIHPTDSDIVLTEAGSGCYNRPDYVACEDSSLVRTTDGGETWVPVPNPLYPDGWGLFQIWGMVFDPNDPSLVYALGPGDDPGVYKSVDGGASFSVAAGIGTPLWSNALVAAPTTPTTLYMGTGTSAYDWARGIWRSTDGAASWQPIDVGLPTDPIVRNIVIHPTDLLRLYIAVQAAADAGFYTSADGGDSWVQLAGAGLPAGSGGLALALDPVTPQVLWGSVSAGGVLGLYRSDDGGATWRSFSTGLDSLLIWDLMIDPADHNHLLAATRAGLWEITVVPRTLTVTKVGSGAGTVTSAPAGIDCGATCSAGFTSEVVVTLAASATAGSVFAGWSGEGCSGTGTCEVAMAVARSVTARFNPNGPNLEVTLAAAPADPVQRQELDGVASLRNVGTATATGAMLTFWPPIGAASFVSAASSQGSCAGTGPVMCSIGTLATGATATVTLRVLPGSAGTLPFRATAAAAADVDPDNNTALLEVACRAARQAPVGVNAWTLDALEGGDVFRFGIDALDSDVVYAATLNGAFKSSDRGLHWTRVSPISTAAVVPHPTLSGVVYLADFSRQIHKSSDGGATWPLVGTGVPPLVSYARAGGFAFWPGDPQKVFYYRSDGVYRTTDGGATWLALGLPAQANNSIELLVDPNGGTPVLYLSTRYGVWRSTTSGDSWQSASSGLPVNPDNGTRVIDGLALVPGTPATLLAAHQNRNVYASTDGATSWQPRSTSPVFQLGRLAVDPDGLTVYSAGWDAAGEAASHRRAFWTSPDLGATWGLLRTSYNLTAIAVDPVEPGYLYAGMAEGVYVSADSGLTWSPASVGLRAMEFDGIAFQPGLPATFYAHGSNAGIFKTTDGGETFSNVTANLISPINGTLVVDPNDPSAVLSAGMLQEEQSDPSFFDYIVRSDDAGASWSKVGNSDPEASWYLQPWGLVALPTQPTTWYAGGPTEGVFKSVDGGATFACTSEGLPEGVWVTDLISADSSGAALFVTGQTGVFKSIDGAASWVDSSVGLPAAQAQRLAVDPSDPSTLYAATSAGVFKTMDGGGLWVGVHTGWPLASDGITPAQARAMAVDPIAPEVLYASTIVDGAAEVYASRDGGGSWRLLQGNAGLEANAIWRLVLDPADHDHLLAAARGGLYETRLDLRRLTVTLAGSGVGAATSSPEGISCGTTCSYDFAVGAAVDLTATPEPGSDFVGWSGACTGSGICSVTMSEARALTATFEPAAGIFSDGFESGDCEAWDLAVGEPV